MRQLAALRAPIIAGSTALTEREHAKTAALTELVAQTLEGRGIDADAALLAAQVGMAAFATAIRRWATPPGADLHAQVDRTFMDLHAITASLVPTNSL